MYLSFPTASSEKTRHLNLTADSSPALKLGLVLGYTTRPYRGRVEWTKKDGSVTSIPTVWVKGLTHGTVHPYDGLVFILVCVSMKWILRDGTYTCLTRNRDRLSPGSSCKDESVDELDNPE